MDEVSIVAEAASWAIGSQLSAVLPERFQLIEGHPGGGQSDVLWLADPAEPWPRNEVLINRLGSGSIRVHHPDGGETFVGGPDLWDGFGCGRTGIAQTVSEILEVLGVPIEKREATTRDRVHEAIALTMRHAALYGLPWRCLWGVEDTAGYPSPDQRAGLFRPYLEDLVDVALGPEGPTGSPGNYWFVVDHNEQPVAAFDAGGYITLPHAASFADLTSATQYPPPAEAVDTLLGPVIRSAVLGTPATHLPPAFRLGLPATLSAFTRKERLFVFGFASGALNNRELHGPSLTLDPPFRTALSGAIGCDVPAHAWASVDHHLSWIHGALQWHGGATAPGQLEHFPLSNDTNGGAWVTGSQEDVDLVIAWSDNETARLVLVEAKAYGAWDNKQADSKLARMSAIRAAAPPGVDVRFVLCSPHRPVHLASHGWPDWALSPNGSPAWMKLPAPRLRVSTERCDDHGHPSAAGDHWHIKGPLP